MNTDLPKLKPHGLFRYLYDHYQLRSRDFERCLSPVRTPEILDAVGKIDENNLEAYLPENSWLIAITRPNLNHSVKELREDLSPLARGNYLAGFTELTYFGGPQDESRISFISEQLENDLPIEFTPDTACQIGCALLGLGLDETFADFLKFDIDWEQAVDRTSPTNTWRWKTIDRLSTRMIDIFLEASLILKRPDVTKFILDYGADPNIPVWQLERSSNALYSALSYGIKSGLANAVDALLKHGADPRGLEFNPLRSPLALAFQEQNVPLIKRLLAAGASLEDGRRYTEAPMVYEIGSPVEWVDTHLSELLGLLPLEAKPLFHSPHAQGGQFFTLLQCVWDDLEKLSFAEEIGMDLRLTAHEVARLIQTKRYATFCALVERLGESVKKEALARVQQKWPDFHCLDLQ